MWSQNAYNKQILETISYTASLTYYDALIEIFTANQLNNIGYVQETIKEFAILNLFKIFRCVSNVNELNYFLLYHKEFTQSFII